MEPTRDTAVLFANVIGGADLQARAGEAVAREMVGDCLARVRRAAETCGGRIVKTLRDGIMVLAASADAGADCAAAMHGEMDGVPLAYGSKLGLGVGFHYGPVIQKDGDVFGATVNLASRIAEQAASGNILTTQETGQRLCALYRKWIRQLYSVRVRGISGDVQLCELLWRMDGNTTAPGPGRRVAAAPSPRVVLRLRYRGREIVRRRENDEITIGRDEDCGLTIADDQASRQHCRIERRGARFVLTDHSANGTFVTLSDQAEVALHREDLTLHSHGWLAFGQPRATASDVVEFDCEES